MSQNQSDERCAWCGNEPATDGHHLFPRSTSPQMIDDPDNIVRLGRKCHQKATDNPEVLKMFQEYFFMKQDEPILTLEYIAKQLRDKKYLSPRDITRYKGFLAGEYYFQSARYVEAKVDKFLRFNELRKTANSKADAELQIEITDEGKNFTIYKYTLEAIEEMQRTLFTMIMQYDKEAKNLN